MGFKAPYSCSPVPWGSPSFLKSPRWNLSDGDLKAGNFKITMSRERVHDYDSEGATNEMSYREAANFLRERFESSLDMGGVEEGEFTSVSDSLS